jgi:hypothetical protein
MILHLGHVLIYIWAKMYMHYDIMILVMNEIWEKIKLN